MNRKLKLDEVSNIIDSLHQTPTYSTDGYPMVRVTDVKERLINFKDTFKVSKEIYEKFTKKYSPQKGDIIMTRVGSFGSCSYIAESRNFCLGQNTVVISPKINGNYLYYCLISNSIKNQINGFATGSTQKTISLKDIKNINILLPESDSEIDKIAKVLSDLDAKIEINNKINAELEAMAKTLYDYWFVQFDFTCPEGLEGQEHLAGKPYKSSGGLMVFNEELKREIPVGWEDGVLSDIADINMGQSPSGSSYNEDGIGTVFYQGSTDFGQRFPTVRKFTTEPSRMANKNDILLSVRAPVGTLNQAIEDCCIGRGLASLREKNGSISFLWSQMEYFKQIFDRRNASGTTFGSITKDDLFNMKLCIPPNEIVNQFKNIVDPLHDKIIINSKENQKLSELRDWLLPMLMNGQVTSRASATTNMRASATENQRDSLVVEALETTTNYGETKDSSLGMVAEESGKYGK